MILIGVSTDASMDFVPFLLLKGKFKIVLGGFCGLADLRQKLEFGILR